MVDVAEGARELEHLVEGRCTARHGTPCITHVGGRLRGGEADRAGVERLAHDPAHLPHFFFRGFALGRLLAHHVHAHRGVPDERADVDRRSAFVDRVEILGEGLEGPCLTETGAQRVERHPLDALERAQDQIAVLGAGGRDAEAAVPHHHARHAVPGRDREHAIPEDLRVVVGVDVDEARRDDAPAGVEGGGRRALHVAGRGDASVADAEVALGAGGAGAVDERAAANEQIEGFGHGSSVRRLEFEIGFQDGVRASSRAARLGNRRRRSHSVSATQALPASLNDSVSASRATTGA